MGENANISPNWSWQRVLDEDGIEQVTPYSTGYSGWKATPYWGTELEGKSPSTITNMMRERSQQTNPNYKSRNESIWDAISTGFMNNLRTNPVATIGGGLGTIGNIWQAFDYSKRQKQALALDREKYELQKQIALNNEQRNQEQWDMLKRQRAGTSL